MNSCGQKKAHQANSGDNDQRHAKMQHIHLDELSTWESWLGSRT
jgi:hypothetical protein